MTKPKPPGPRIRSVPRERDEEVLNWLWLRDEKVSIHEIARRYNTSYQNIQGTLRNVDKETEQYFGPI